MRLQHKRFEFNLLNGEKLNYPINPTETLVLVNDKKTDIKLSELFHGKLKEKKNSITGYSFIELLDENGNIQINDKIYNIKFVSGEQILKLSSVGEPTGFTYKDVVLSEEQEKEIEQKIESSSPSETATQPQQDKTDESPVGDETSISSVYENEDYESEKKKDYLQNFVEYNTEPKSNLRALVRAKTSVDANDVTTTEEEKIIFVEIFEDDYEVLNEKDYPEFELNHETKTINIKQLV